MKFKVRDGFVCKVVGRIDVGGGNVELQESAFYGGKLVDFSPDEAAEHSHKLEPLDDGARAWLESRHEPPPAPALGVGSPELQALAMALAQKLLSGQQPLPLTGK